MSSRGAEDGVELVLVVALARVGDALVDPGIGGEDSDGERAGGGAGKKEGKGKEEEW